jgi:hypothetical protein
LRGTALLRSEGRHAATGQAAVDRLMVKHGRLWAISGGIRWYQAQRRDFGFGGRAECSPLSVFHDSPDALDEVLTALGDLR